MQKREWRQWAAFHCVILLAPLLFYTPIHALKILDPPPFTTFHPLESAQIVFTVEREHNALCRVLVYSRHDPPIYNYSLQLPEFYLVDVCGHKTTPTGNAFLCGPLSYPMMNVNHHHNHSLEVRCLYDDGFVDSNIIMFDNMLSRTSRGTIKISGMDEFSEHGPDLHYRLKISYEMFDYHPDMQPVIVLYMHHVDFIIFNLTAPSGYVYINLNDMRKPFEVRAVLEAPLNGTFIAEDFVNTHRVFNEPPFVPFPRRFDANHGSVHKRNMVKLKSVPQHAPMNVMHVDNAEGLHLTFFPANSDEFESLSEIFPEMDSAYEEMQWPTNMLPNIPFTNSVADPDDPLPECSQIVEHVAIFFRVLLHEGFYHLVHDNMWALYESFGGDKNITLVMMDDVDIAREPWRSIMLLMGPMFSDHPMYTIMTLPHNICFRRVQLGVTGRLGGFEVGDAAGFGVDARERLPYDPIDLSLWRVRTAEGEFQPCLDGMVRATFVLRPKARKIVNFDDFVEEGYRQGLCVYAVNFDTLSFLETISILAETDILVSNFGAALSNVAFMKPGSVIAFSVPYRYHGDDVNIYSQMSKRANVHCVHVLVEDNTHFFPNYDLLKDKLAGVVKYELAAIPIEEARSFESPHTSQFRNRYPPSWLFTWQDSYVPIEQIRRLLEHSIGNFFHRPPSGNCILIPANSSFAVPT